MSETGYQDGLELVICLSGLMHAGTVAYPRAQLVLATPLCVDHFENVLETSELIHTPHVGVNLPIKVFKH